MGRLMRLREFVRASKVITNLGAWTDKGMPKTNSKFPLWKPKGVRLAAAWRWRVDEFTMDDGFGKSRVGRMLIAYRFDKEEYLAYVGLDEMSGHGVRVIGCLEFHGTHPGWHVHGSCAPQLKGHVGRTRHEGMRRVPGGKYYRQNVFITGDAQALSKAEEFFGFVGLTPPPPPPQIPPPQASLQF